MTDNIFLDQDRDAEPSTRCPKRSGMHEFELHTMLRGLGGHELWGVAPTCRPDERAVACALDDAMYCRAMGASK